MSRQLLLLLALAFPVGAMAGDAVQGLEAIHRRDVSTAKGERYNERAISYLFTHAAFMQKCAPPDTPKAQSFTFYITVATTGEVEGVTVAPINKTSSCFKKHVLPMRFPKPSARFVVEERLRFY